MKRIISFFIIVLSLSIVMFCQADKKDLKIKIPEFKKSIQVFEEKDRIWESAIEDLDGDGDLDLVMTDLGNSTEILFNDGKGYFVKSDQKLPAGTHGIAVGDVDKDGDNDLFFALLFKNGENPLYLNDGKGLFKGSDNSPVVDASESVQLLDIDNDGDLDAFFWWKCELFLNDGKGNFSKKYKAISKYSSFCDLNKDGSVDLLSLIPGEGIKVFLNDKKGNFTEYSLLKKKDTDFCNTGFADIDNDGDIDVVLGNGKEGNEAYAGILLNDGTGRLSDSGQKLAFGSYAFIGLGDLNNDGSVDIVFTDREKPSTIWLNDGKGTFSFSGITLGEGGLWNNCIIKDIDNDGDQDIFITKVFKGSSGLWFNQLMENKK